MAEAEHLPVFHVVGFTGHRQVADAATLERILREALEGLTKEPGVEWLALSSIAAGADVLFAKAALALGMGWEAVLPFPQSDFQLDFQPEEWREAEALLGRAEHVRAIGQRSSRKDSYLDCGMEIVNHCDLLLAVWDGEPARGRGGTAEIVAYARELGRPLVIVDAESFAIRRENFSRLKLGDRHLAFLNRLPPVEVGPGEDADHDDPGRRRVLAFQRKVDHAARHSAHARRLTFGTVGLHVLATALAAATLSFALQSPLFPWAKLLCLVGALGVASLLRSHRERRDWVRCRLAAEISRSALATWGLPRAVRLFDDFDWAGLEPLRRSLDVLQRRSVRARPVHFDPFKQRYVKERIDDQIAYFARQEGKAVPQLAWLRSGFFVSTTLAIAFTAVYAGHTLMPRQPVPDWMRSWVFDFGPIILPVLAAGFISLASINDLHRRVARYHEMRVRLESARKEAVFVQTWSSLERVVAKAERALLQEVFEWHSVTSFSETHPSRPIRPGRPNMLILHDPRCAEYGVAHHPERSARVRRSAAHLRAGHPGWSWREPGKEAADETLRLAHSAAHLRRLEEPRDFDGDTPYYPGIASHARRAVTAAVDAAREALRSREAVFALMRPPGHHATANAAMGFCYLNQVAVAALAARRDLGAERVAIWDFDAHHGNGTEAILHGREGFLYCSVHQYPCYPGTGEADTGNCRNWPVPPGAPRAEHRDALRASWEAVTKFRPELVLVSAGFDAYARDPLTEMTLEREDFAELGGWLREGGLPAAAVLEGGYSDELPQLIDAFLSAWAAMEKQG